MSHYLYLKRLFSLFDRFLVRYRQVHDFWHVLADLPPTILGELALKAYEFSLTNLPVALFSTVFGQVRLNPSEIKTLFSIYLPWAIRARLLYQQDAATLLLYDYEKNLEKSVEDVRKELKFEIAPRIE